MDEKILEEVATRFSRIVTIEDGVRNGGLGSAVTEWMNDTWLSILLHVWGLPDNFVDTEQYRKLKQICGIDVESIKKVLTSEKG